MFFVLFFVFWPLYCLFFVIYAFQLHLWYLLAIVLSVLRDIRIPITPLVSFGHCIVCSSWYTHSNYTFGHCIVCSSWYTHSNYTFGIFWPLYCLFFVIYAFQLHLWYLLAIVLSVLRDIRIPITPLVSFGHCIVCSSWYTHSNYTFGIFWPLYCLFFVIYGFQLHLWYLLAIVLSVLRDIRSNYTFGIFILFNILSNV